MRTVTCAFWSPKLTMAACSSAATPTKFGRCPGANRFQRETAEAAGRRLAQELGLLSSAEELLRQAMWTDVGGAKHGQTDADQTSDDDHQAGMVSSARPRPELLELVEFSALQVLPSPTLSAGACWCPVLQPSAEPHAGTARAREVRGGLQLLRRQAPSPHLAPTL